MEWVGLFGVELDNIKKNSPSNVLTNYIMYIKAQKWKREMHKIQGIKKHFSKVCLSFPYCSRMEKPLDYINELSFWIAFKTHDLFHHYSNEKQSTINQNSDINDQHNYFYCSKYPYLITNGIYLKRSVTHLFSVIIARFLYSHNDVGHASTKSWIFLSNCEKQHAMANLVLSGIHCLCNCWANVQISLTLLPAMLSIKLEGFWGISTRCKI